MIQKEGKKLIFVINKVDLVPEENHKAWKKYYKNQKQLTVSFQCNKMMQPSKKPLDGGNDQDGDEKMDEEKEQSP